MAHRRRGVGVGRSTAANNAAGAARVQRKADEMKAQSFQSAVETVERLQTELSAYAKNNQRSIQNDPAFRQQFLQMCAPLGVDPLVSPKGFWAKTLGVGMGDFYYELSVKVAEVCFATRSQNGGIMPVNQCLQILNSRSAKYNAGDIKIAVKKLGQLGGGFRIVQVGGGGNSNGDGSGSGIGLSRKTRPSSSSSTDMIISVPTELDEDHTSILTLASGQGGCVTVDDVQQQLGNWSMERIDRALTLLLQEGMAWKDDFHGIEYYWFPSIWKEQRQEQEEQEQQR